MKRLQLLTRLEDACRGRDRAFSTALYVRWEAWFSAKPAHVREGMLCIRFRWLL